MQNRIHISLLLFHKRHWFVYFLCRLQPEYQYITGVHVSTSNMKMLIHRVSTSRMGLMLCIMGLVNYQEKHACERIRVLAGILFFVQT